mmetsp:Transcript_2019/g.2872  ORF Transcript_2019/g.2872 Transcript_2019/m.2872 type:complete len:261 (+) Transcript_2019:122-904(+)
MIISSPASLCLLILFCFITNLCTQNVSSAYLKSPNLLRIGMRNKFQNDKILITDRSLGAVLPSEGVLFPAGQFLHRVKHYTKQDDNEDSPVTKFEKKASADVKTGGFRKVKEYFVVPDETLFKGDIGFILIGCQVLGLIDVLNNPSFWMNGGFFQPIYSNGSESTLGTLVFRVSVIGLCWILSALKNDGYSFGATVDDKTSIKCALTIFVDFASLRIIIGLLMATLMHSPVDTIELLREAWMALLCILTFRVLYSQFFRM